MFTKFKKFSKIYKNFYHIKDTLALNSLKRVGRKGYKEFFRVVTAKEDIREVTYCKIRYYLI